MKQFIQNLSKWLTIWLWFMIVVWISYLIIKATRSSTNPWSDAAPNDLYVSNGETLKASKRNSLVDKSLACPAGFTLVANKGNVIWCIQSTIQWAAAFATAEQDCYSTYWARLPTYSELYIAAKNYSLPNWANYALTSSTYVYNNWSRNYGILVLNTSTLAYSVWLLTTASDYRCFIPR